MNLNEFFATIGPFLHGYNSTEETVIALYGSGEDERLQCQRKQRLDIYGRFCRLHRYQVLESVYVYLRRHILHLFGETDWNELVESYFRRYPMRHFELNANGDNFPEFLAEYADAKNWPQHLAALADFEWWEWQTLIAVDNADDDETANITQSWLRLASTVELRPYSYDLLSWIDNRDERTNGTAWYEDFPTERETLVLFWRDRNLKARRDFVTLNELNVLKAINETCFPTALLETGMPIETIQATLQDLHSAGIVLGV